MKKRSIMIVCLALCAAILSSLFVSCSEASKLLRMEESERADAFFDIVNEDPAEAYTVEMKMEITGSLYEVSFEASAESETTYIGYRSTSPIYHSEVSSTVKAGADGIETEQKTKKITGYRGGKLYEMSEQDGVKSLLSSSISAEDYLKHQEFLVGYSDEELVAIHKSAMVKSCNQKENGTWEATFSGYPEESVLAIIDYSFDSSVLLLDGYKVKDVVFTVKSNEEFIPTDWEYEIVFEKTSADGTYTEPKAKTVVEFDDIGTAEAPEVDLSAYTEVEALADLQKIRCIIADKFVADSATFTAKSSQRVLYNSSSQYTEETDKVTAKTENGKYSFNIDARIVSPSFLGGTDATVTYADGVYTMSGKKISTVTQEMSDASARAYISRLIDPAGLSSIVISDIALRREGNTHLFTIADPDYSTLEASLASMGAGNIKAEAKVGVDYENGVISKYEYTMTVTARVSGRTLTVEVCSEVTFDTGDEIK